MIDLAALRDTLAQKNADRNMETLSATLELKPSLVEVRRIDAEATQVEVRWPDGTIDVLGADELSALAPSGE